jgi:hypothetical protein
MDGSPGRREDDTSVSAPLQRVKQVERRTVINQQIAGRIGVGTSWDRTPSLMMDHVRSGHQTIPVNRHEVNCLTCNTVDYSSRETEIRGRAGRDRDAMTCTRQEQRDMAAYEAASP